MNAWLKHGALQLKTLLAFAAIAMLALMLGAGELVLIELAMYGGLALLFARFVEQRRRRIFLDYALQGEAAERYDRLGIRLSTLATSGRLLSVASVDQHGDWKRNAGATQEASCKPMALKRAGIAHVVTNLRPWSLVFQNQQLGFFPDHLLIWQDGRFSARSYQSLKVSTQIENVVWSEPVPPAAEVVDHRWRYIRLDGERDQRYADNERIPVLRTCRFTLEGEAGLLEVLQSTDTVAALEAAYALQTCIDSALLGQSAATASAELSSRRSVPRWRRAETWVAIATGLFAFFCFAAFRGPAMREPAPAAVAPVALPAPVLSPRQAPPPAIDRVVSICPLRARPSSGARRIKLMAKDTEVTVLEDQSGWRRVQTRDGIVGWTGPKCWQAPEEPAPRRKPPSPRGTGSSKDSLIDPYEAERSEAPAANPEPEPRAVQGVGPDDWE